jgi:endonuclease/exonuclease/phosphatase family metal-dependent hydrolase
LPSPADLAVVSWNQHDGEGDLERLIVDLRSGRHTGGVPSREFVLLLQEALRHDVLSLAERLGLFAFFFAPGQQGAYEEGNALISTQPLLNARGIELPRERQRRTAVAASVIVGGQPLAILNAHLENRVSWWRGGLLSDSARGRQARALLEVMPPRVPGVLGGDLNTWLGASEPAWQAIVERFPDRPPDRFEPTFRDRLVLDHLFFDLPQGWDAWRRVIRDKYGSDHHPVIAALFVGQVTELH